MTRTSVVPEYYEEMRARLARNPPNGMPNGTIIRIDDQTRLHFPQDFQLRPAGRSVLDTPPPTVQPPFPSRPVRLGKASFEGGGLAFETISRLSGGMERLSQTYLCKATDTDTTLVLKIFQPEYYTCPHPRAWHFQTYERMFKIFPSAEKLYSAEAAAYERLTVYQGNRIPHSYGFYRITLPSGDTSVAHLMEYIDAKCWSETPMDGPTWMRHVKAYIECLLEVRRFGICHGDSADRNIRLVQTESGDTWHFVLLDWASVYFDGEIKYGVKDYGSFWNFVRDSGWDLNGSESGDWLTSECHALTMALEA